MTPVEPIRRAEPPTPPAPPSINQSGSANEESTAAAITNDDNPVESALPKVVPEDESIDMVIIEDDSATY